MKIFSVIKGNVSLFLWTVFSLWTPHLFGYFNDGSCFSFCKWLHMHTYRYKYPFERPLTTYVYWNLRTRTWHLEYLGWMSSWQSGKLIKYIGRMFPKQSNLRSNFQVAGTCHPPPINLNPFSIRLVQYCLTTYSV